MSFTRASAVVKRQFTLVARAFRSRTMILDGLSSNLRPVLQVIDKFDTCRKLGAIFEVRVKNGRLLVCSIDLAGDLNDRPASRQLKRSLLTYMAGDRFRPPEEVRMQDLDRLFSPSVP